MFPLVHFRGAEERCNCPPPVPCAPCLKNKHSFWCYIYFVLTASNGEGVFHTSPSNCRTCSDCVWRHKCVGAYGWWYLMLCIYTHLSPHQVVSITGFFHSNIANRTSGRWLSVVKQLSWTHYALIYTLKCKIVPSQCTSWGVWPLWNTVDSN